MPNQDILDLQPTHIQELQKRYEQALAEHGYDSLLIASGAAPYRYRDDQTYVFQGFGPFLRLTRTLEEGMVVTIEPGLYFIPSLLEPVLNGPQAKYLNRSLLDELQGCGGIRIEDNVAVTASGARNLTRETER